MIVFVQMMTLCGHLPILWQGQILLHRFLYRKKKRQWIFLETIVAGDLNVGRCGQLIE